MPQPRRHRLPGLLLRASRAGLRPPDPDAIKASFSFTTSNLGETILFFLLAAVVSAIGGIACGIGILVAYPVVLVGQAYTFRVLNNEPVTPAA